MISSALAMLLYVAAPNATAESREAFARCLKDVVRTSLEEKKDAATFQAALASACKDKEVMLKSALVSSDVAMGLKRAASEKASAEQIADYRVMAKEDFEAAIAEASTPQ